MSNSYYNSQNVSVTADTEMPAAAALTDAFANPTTTVVGAMNMVFNGATWDRAPGSTTNGLTIGGNVAHDGVDAGNPVAIGGNAQSATSLPTAVSVGDRVKLAVSTQGELFVYLTRLLSGEDQTNNLIQVQQKPVAASTYSPTRFADYGSNATANVKASAGNVFSLSCYNANAAARYIQLHNTATTPGGGAAPLYSFLVPSLQQIVIGNDFFTQAGVNFSTGIAFAFSTTQATYTAGAAGDQFTQVLYI